MQTIHSVHDFDGNRITEYDFDPLTSTSTLLREYIWRGGRQYHWAIAFISSDSIGRHIFATDALGVKVWEASYLPFGGVHSST